MSGSDTLETLGRTLKVETWVRTPLGLPGEVLEDGEQRLVWACRSLVDGANVGTDMRNGALRDPAPSPRHSRVAPNLASRERRSDTGSISASCSAERRNSSSSPNPKVGTTCTHRTCPVFTPKGMTSKRRRRMPGRRLPFT